MAKRLPDKSVEPKKLKPIMPKALKPLGGGTGEENPAMTPHNSQKGVKQRMSLDVPGIKLR